MLLAQRYRDVLCEMMLKAIPAPQDCQTLVNSVKQGSWNSAVPLGAAYTNAVARLIEVADTKGWIRDLVKRLVDDFSNHTEFATVLAEIDRPATVRTSTNPFDEVLLDGGRPFVNRRPLRSQLLNLTNQAGESVLLIDGEPKSGKTFSYYLINHVAPTKGFIVNKFSMARLPKPDDLAEEILGRLGVDNPAATPKGNESAERWAWKLADKVAQAISDKRSLRMFVFDDFPFTTLPDGTIADVKLPEGTTSFIVRLATYADEELRSYLRVIMMRFRAPLPPDLDDIVLRDNAQPFTATDMLAAIMQVAAARGWSITEAAVQAKIDEFLQAGAARSLNDRFRFLRELLKKLAEASS